jgi:putative cardiolipin synthase
MRLLRIKFLTVLLLPLALAANAMAQSLPAWLSENCAECEERMTEKTGVYILEKGEESLIGRAWLTQNAAHTIDVQYFIWSTDNVGTLAAEQLLRAAERGIRVRVLVDDLLVDAQGKTLLLLSAHPNAEIRIYNPNISVGVNWWQRLKNAVTNFRMVNQRMHDKTAIFDGIAGITGGRNMADEYFDFNHTYNFRDRDVLLLGPAVSEMSENFEEFWNSPFVHSVETILEDEGLGITPDAVAQRSRELHAYAADPKNFDPQVHVKFISDIPGKNKGDLGLGGGGEATQYLIDAVRNARSSILIQSPYLIMPEGGIELFKELVERGVRIRISTNSLSWLSAVSAFAFRQTRWHRPTISRLLAATMASVTTCSKRALNFMSTSRIRR